MKPKPQSWRGGVSPDVAALERTGTAPSRSYPATIVRRSEDGRARLRVVGLLVEVGERVLVDGDWWTVAADVYAVHGSGLVDVKEFWAVGGEARVQVRKSPL